MYHFTMNTPARRIPPAPPSLLSKIERALADHDMSPRQFGRNAVGDTALVFGLRAGRDIGSLVRARVNTYLVALEAANV